MQIIDPWGKVLADASESVGIITAEIDLNQIAAIRIKMPVIQHQRPQLYQVVSSRFTIPSGERDLDSFTFGQASVKYSSVFLENDSARAFVNKKCVVPGRK